MIVIFIFVYQLFHNIPLSFILMSNLKEKYERCKISYKTKFLYFNAFSGSMKPLKILFVCIGNTCRSPMAESVMKHWVQEYDLNWEIDSAGLRTWNVGRKPNERCIKVLAENGLTTKHVGRQVTLMDFYNFDYILAMDEHNLHELQTLMKDSSQERCAKVELLGKYIDRPEDQIIRDPYFCNAIGGFRCAFLQITESCQNFIAEHMNFD